MKEFSTVNPNKVTIAENLTGQFRCKYKGYGFITKKDTNEDIFVPFIGVKKLENAGGNVNLKPGDDVEFDIITSQDGKEIAWNVTKIRKNDKLFEQIDVEIKAHQPDVLKSYSFFATQAANALDINILESWPEPEPHKVRKTLLRSAFVVKKSRVQYEFRYSQFDQRGSYTKLLRRSKKFHQMCILSCTIQWCYPKYCLSSCHKNKILKN